MTLNLHIGSRILISWSQSHLYNEASIIPNVPTYIPPRQPGGGSLSDNRVVIIEPRQERIIKHAKELVIKKTRRVDDNKMQTMGQWIQKEAWEAVYDGKTATGRI